MKLFHTILAIILFALSAQAQAAATLDSTTLQLDIPYLVYQSSGGNLPLQASLAFVPGTDGELLWEIRNFSLLEGEYPALPDAVLKRNMNLEINGLIFQNQTWNITLYFLLEPNKFRWQLDDYAAITANIQSITLTQGQEVVHPVTGIGIKALNNAISFDLTEATDSQGNSEYRFRFPKAGDIELILPPAGLQARKAVPRFIQKRQPRAAERSFINQLWHSFPGKVFVDDNRLPEHKQDGRVEIRGNWIGDELIIPTLSIKLNQTPAQLWSVLPPCSSAQADCHRERSDEPVVFVHGYTLGTGLGGGADTWGNFPNLLAQEGYFPFEFAWRSAARFNDVANELGQAVNMIFQATGKPVHIVAHSFGGVLVRTWLQNLASNTNTPAAANLIASVMTLGTPHSGVSDSNDCFATPPGSAQGTALPKGQDLQGIFNIDILSFEGCEQISCLQSGEWVGKLLYDVNSLFDVYPGQISAQLANNAISNLPAVDILVGIGLTTFRGLNSYIDDGDGLITYAGQRFMPLDTVTGSCNGDDGNVSSREPPAALRNATQVGNAKVTERILGFGDVHPDDANPDSSFGGYRHSTAVNGDGNTDMIWGSDVEAEPYVSCLDADTCEHHGFKNALFWLQAHSITTTSNTNPSVTTARLNDTGITCTGETSNQQDCSHGRDATNNDDSDGHAGFSFSNVSTNQCVFDNVTGLMWQSYTSDIDFTWEQAFSYVNSLNSSGLCGYHDWRLPSVNELQSIIDYSTTPSIDVSFFSNAKSDYYWTSTSYAVDLDYAWSINFYNRLQTSRYKNNYSYIRLVRKEQ
jgi:pimeloyl-ACP methyl ester carboxylesterase